MGVSDKPCRILAVAGGKGGTGKSFITSSLGTYLALKGNDVVLIDADLGGANLHAFFGIKRPKSSLTDFFEKKLPLKDIVVNCGIERMGIVAGSISSLHSENIAYAQKLKLLRHIRALDADYIFIDLGAGSHSNTIDTFLLADTMIVITIPEITAVENMYHFIKNVYFRKLNFAFGIYGMKDLIQDTWKQREEYGIATLAELVSYLRGISSQVREIFEKEMEGFKIQIIMNQTRGVKDLKIGENLSGVCRRLLGVRALFAGHVEYDASVPICLNAKQLFMIDYQYAPAARELGRLAELFSAAQQQTGTVA
jgi:flagellar biosynthesis protein FlhG